MQLKQVWCIYRCHNDYFHPLREAVTRLQCLCGRGDWQTNRVWQSLPSQQGLNKKIWGSDKPTRYAALLQLSTCDLWTMTLTLLLLLLLLLLLSWKFSVMWHYFLGTVLLSPVHQLWHMLWRDFLRPGDFDRPSDHKTSFARHKIWTFCVTAFLIHEYKWTVCKHAVNNLNLKNSVAVHQLLFVLFHSKSLLDLSFETFHSHHWVER